MKRPIRFVRRVGPLMLTSVLMLGLSRQASAATITIGTLSLGPSIDPYPDPYRGTVPYIGSYSTVVNASPVTFLDVYIRTTFIDTSVGSGSIDCSGVVIAAGAQSRCGTGPLEYAPPAGLWGIGFAGYATGRLSSTSFLLPDGSTFIANSQFWGVPEFGDLYTVQDTVWDLVRPIVIEGTVVPVTTDPGPGPGPGPTPVPEPGTLALVAGGASMLWRRAKRRA